MIGSTAGKQNMSPFGATGEFRYSQSDFETISNLVRAHAGIVMPPEKAMLIFSRLTKLLRQRGMTDFKDYIELIRHDSDERRQAIEALTTNHTFFFREPHHFEHFSREVRPTLINRLRAGKRVRMWSSASSSGQEVYSLAMTMLGTDRSQFQQILGGDVALLATDLAQKVLDEGSKGEYPIEQLREIPDDLAGIWTRAGKSSFQIDPRLVNLVRFRRLNLLDAWPIKNRFDVIFCRNVTIYFDEPTKETLLGRLADHLEPGGHLYIGHSERIPESVAHQFAPVGQTAFRKISR